MSNKDNWDPYEEYKTKEDPHYYIVDNIIQYSWLDEYWHYKNVQYCGTKSWMDYDLTALYEAYSLCTDGGAVQLYNECGLCHGKGYRWDDPDEKCRFC